MVERFNGRISHVVKSTRFANADEMKTTLTQYLELYDHHIVQRNLGHLTPVKALKEWYRKKPELFNKRVYDHMGLDTYSIPKIGHLPASRKGSWLTGVSGCTTMPSANCWH
jgi:hypothetical protein